jgi:hypothetical protein
VLALVVADLWKRRDAGSWLLALWVLGTLVFTGIRNWTINGRSILPMAPAVGILLARRWQQRGGANGRIMIPLAAGALFAFLVARSDFLLAAAVRQSAVQTYERYGRGPQTLWFEGHWGFQYYMTELGGQAASGKHFILRPGDFLAVPVNNTNLKLPPAPGEELQAEGPRYLTDMNANAGAGFYASKGGPLPFAFGQVRPELVLVYRKIDPGTKP